MDKSPQHDTDVAPQPRMLPIASTADAGGACIRIDSRDLFQQTREVEIAHDGRIYRLRLTQLNKLILTA